MASSRSPTTHSISNYISLLYLTEFSQIHLKPQFTVNQRRKLLSECICLSSSLPLTPSPFLLPQIFKPMINIVYHQNLQLRIFHQPKKQKLKPFWEFSVKGRTTIVLFGCQKLQQFLRVLGWWFQNLQLHKFCYLFLGKLTTHL